MLSDSKLESSVNSVECFGASDSSETSRETCSKEEVSVVIVTAVHEIRPYQDEYPSS